MADLKTLCDAALANKFFKPSHGLTYCNFAVEFIARGMGCLEFENHTANQIYQLISTNASGKWLKSGGSQATIWALSNGFAIAGLPSQRLGEDHGHVCAIYPLGMQASGSLKHDVPMVANVGKTVGVMKSSAAFPVADGEAEYFIYRG